MQTRDRDQFEQTRIDEHAEQPEKRRGSALKRTTGELSVGWNKFRFLVRDAAFTPEWLGSPWNHLIVAYLAAFLIPCLTTLLTYAILIWYPTFSISSSLPVLGVLIVAIVWGTGPGLLTTLISAILLNYFLLSPALTWSLDFKQLFETSIFLITGLIISIIASRIEKVRAEAIQAKREVEYEKEQLVLAREQSYERAIQLEAVFQAIADSLFIIDARGGPPQMNRAARQLLAIPDEAAQPSVETYPFQLFDLEGHLIPFEAWPEQRVRRGEIIKGENAVDVRLQSHDGQSKYISMTGSPMLGADGQIIGSVIVCRDVTERRSLEQRTHNALDAVLEMTHLLVRSTEITGTLSAGSSEAKYEERIRAVAQRLATLTNQVIGSERLSISIVEPDSGIMQPVAVVGLSPEQERKWWAEQREQQSRLSDSPDQAFVQQLRSGDVLVIDMTKPPMNEAPNPYGIKSMLVAPMLGDEELIGFITLDHGGVEHLYSDEEKNIASAAAKLTATVIERERLLRQRQVWREQESTLLSANQQMANLISLSHDAIIVRTPEGKILSWNKGAENLYGWTAGEALGQSTHDLLRTRFQTSRKAEDKRLEREGRWEGQLLHFHRDGRPVNVDSRQVMIRDDEGQATAVLEINRDISEITRLNNEQAEAYARELSLRETKERMDEFLSIASHELRTPLTTIKGNLQLASMRLNYFVRKALRENNDLEKDLDEITTMLNRAERQVNVQNRLIRDLMDTTHIQVDKIELNMELCDLATLLNDVVTDLRSATPTRTIRVSALQQIEVPVIADADRIRQVISNYLTNAMKYSPPESAIEVNLQCTSAEARVSVRDEGVGLTPEEQQYVWERFYQVKGNKRQKGFSSGLGLGLYICQAIIDGHGGEVGVVSSKGEGATFWFTLPLADANISGDNPATLL